MIEQQPGEGCIGGPAAVVAPEVGVADDGVEQRGVSAEPVGVDRGRRVDVHAAIEQPARDLHFVELDAQVQQRRCRERGAGEFLGVAAQFGREDLVVGEGAAKEVGIATEMLLEQVDASAVQRHRRRVGEGVALPAYISRIACFAAGWRLSDSSTTSTGAMPRPFASTTGAPSSRTKAVPVALRV